MSQSASVKDMILDWYRELESRHAGKIPSVMRTGFVELDQLIGQIKSGDLLLVASEPGGGKSTFLLNVATNNSQPENASILLVSLEANAKRLIERMMAAKSHVSLERLRSGLLEPKDWRHLAEASGQLADANISILDAADWTLDLISNHCRELSDNNTLSLMLVDRLESLPTDQPARWLKKLAREIGVPVIASLQCWSSSGLTDLEQHGDAAFEADVVMHIWDRGKQDDTGRRIAEVAVVKSRIGPIGVAPLRVEWECASFFNA